MFENSSLKFHGSRFKIYDSRRGFSLIEVIIFVAIASILIFVVSNLTADVSNVENFIKQKLQARSGIVETFQMLVTEIRSIGSASNGGYGIESAASSTFIFFSDVDQDGVFERVKYSIGTSTVKRGVVKPTGSPLVYTTSTETVTTVITNVIPSTSTVFFEYFDNTYNGSGTALSYPIDVAKIRVVRVSVRVDTNPGKSPKATFFSETMTIRNFKDQ